MRSAVARAASAGGRRSNRNLSHVSRESGRIIESDPEAPLPTLAEGSISDGIDTTENALQMDATRRAATCEICNEAASTPRAFPWGIKGFTASIEVTY